MHVITSWRRSHEILVNITQKHLKMWADNMWVHSDLSNQKSKAQKVIQSEWLSNSWRMKTVTVIKLFIKTFTSWNWGPQHPSSAKISYGRILLVMTRKHLKMSASAYNNWIHSSLRSQKMEKHKKDSRVKLSKWMSNSLK